MSIPLMGTILNGTYSFESYTQQTWFPNPPLPKEYFTADDLRQAVKNIKCAQIIFILQFTYSGGFINPLLDLTDAKCENRLVITSTGDVSSSTSSENSYKECWSHCSNIDEFTCYFAAALRGYYDGRYPCTPKIMQSVGFDLNSVMCLNGIAGNIPSSLGPQTLTGNRSYLLGGEFECTF